MTNIALLFLTMKILSMKLLDFTIEISFYDKWSDDDVSI